MNRRTTPGEPVAKNILVTGGAGYIGSHTCVELLNAGYEVVIVDNLCNAKEEALERVKRITGKSATFYHEDIRNEQRLGDIFSNHHIDAVIHFAGHKAVGVSVAQPLKYYRNNVSGSMALLKVMTDYNIRNFVFSSSATVYGDPHSVPIRETFPLSATNPYGRSKLIIEEICRDLYNADEQWNIAILRYFNPIGAHESGLIGENCKGIPDNLMPYISQVAIGKLKELSVFGNDYDTRDGTGIRDYIHVVDLATGHIKALESLMNNPGLETYNLGTGRGYSVLEVIKAFEQVSGKRIPYKIMSRRAGDISICYADPSYAENKLKWRAKRDLTEMVEDTWRWQTNNRSGF